MKVLVLGLPKTGTSALFYAIVRNLSGCEELFEPSYFGVGKGHSLDFHLDVESKPANVACKCLCHPRYNDGQWNRVREAARCYEKVVWIDRDPRDRLISENFYAWFKGHRFWGESERQAYLERLRTKERDPSRIPFRSLCEQLPWEKERDFLREREFVTYRNLCEFRSENQDFFKLTYEDFVDKRFSALEAFLSFPIGSSDTRVREVETRVARTRGYGSWRNWFTDEDVEFFEPLYRPYLDLVYNGNYDWELSPEPTFNAKEGSQYVERISQ